MKIVIIGGTGLIGSQLANLLKDQHEVIVASPNTGINTITGEGLDSALENADVVVDVSNSPSFADDDVMNFFRTSTSNLLEAEQKARVKHHIALSVVGTQKLGESGYFRAKQAQEELIGKSSIPYSIVHATQFFEFAGGVAASSIKDGGIFVTDALVQPIASSEVAKFLAKTVSKDPICGIAEIAGPEKMPMNRWVKHYLSVMNRPSEITIEKDAPYFGAVLENDTLVPEKAVFESSIKYEEWIADPQNQ
ncbi:SDR family oxidoreductase [Chryseobacterium sp. 09-1422]|uniref:SDR family oxidoreductase n=1 Tax=Chryseobacterium kimseyorum TaxID=2984028 RepID=A0ABT3I356_9FLAO|nr:SDR family oxidoreductase [Chryseobacterium kimseyorum]MCW3170494.1 SDR family oxidoreductase [Chryseobacterium kimseyorum]